MSLWDHIRFVGSERVQIVVPNTPEDETFYALPCTVEDEVRVRKAVKDPDSPDAWARLMWTKLVDDTGERVFKGVPWLTFRESTPAWLSRNVGEQIYMAGAATTVEQAEGN